MAQRVGQMAEGPLEGLPAWTSPSQEEPTTVDEGRARTQCWGEGLGGSNVSETPLLAATRPGSSTVQSAAVPGHPGEGRASPYVPQCCPWP